jgi:hypothetical protein
MKKTSVSDRFTIIAIAVIAYAVVNISHEIVGHCGTAGLLGVRCRFISTTDIRLIKEITEFPAWKYNIILVAGSAANWTIGLVCLGLLRFLRTPQPALRYFLWLSMSVNLFLASTYVTVAPIIKYGDSYLLVYQLQNQFFWRSAIVLVGAVICWFSFQICRKELGRLIGVGGRAARGVAWELVLPAYITGGILTVTSGLFSQLSFKWAQIQAAGGTFGLMVWLLLLPLVIPEEPTPAQQPFIIPRSIGWIVAGALCALVFIGVLGPGLPL